MTDSHDFQLGIPGFRYSDLHDPARLRELTQVFWHWVAGRDPELWQAYEPYLAARGAGVNRTHESDLLVRMGRHVGAFLAAVFRVETERDGLASTAHELEPVFRFKRDFVSRRAARRAAKAVVGDPAAIEREVERILAASLLEQSGAEDGELRFARATLLLVELEDAIKHGRQSASATDSTGEAIGRLRAQLGAENEDDAGLIARLLHSLEGWVALLLRDPELRSRAAPSWVSLRLAEKLDFPDGLVEIERPDPGDPNRLHGPSSHIRRRDGFKLSDPRWNGREVLDHTHYCVLCHEREKDSCSRGYPLPRTSLAAGKNALGVPLNGCPLDERISEMHALRREGDALGALAVVMRDNPMCPATGHRICNDCMKSCIFQKQEPVNIPQIETGCLMEVLDLPYGFEIYGLLTRWNPLNVRRPYALPYNGVNVLVVGLGPAGISLSQWLLNEGFGVVAIDGLKIEPIAADLASSDGRPPRPIRDRREFWRDLDERPGSGFGGVAEYGITVRWDKNFLTVMDLTLRRRGTFRVFGGVRFGGTLELDDIWRLGFDHVAVAAGAGKPTVVEMKNTLIRNVRTASDFLMGLQLSGAFQRRSLANLQLELPCLVIGSGLTAIDAATEAMAYYPVQVEKLLERTTELIAEDGAEAYWANFTAAECRTLERFLAHGREVRAERERALAAGEAANFVPLLKSWGGVTICYRKRLVDSPAYRLNHEEVIECFEEGVELLENVSPIEAVEGPDGAVEAVIFEKQRWADGKYAATGETVRLAARAVLMAAGTAPNIVYEKEHPGTFTVDAKRGAFLPHTIVCRDGQLAVEPAPGTLESPGFFTSYERNGRFVSFFGDNHPVYAGSVVKAMASAKDGFPAIAGLFAERLSRLVPSSQGERDAAWQKFIAGLDKLLRARVVRVERLTPTVVEVVVHAPLAARKFRPGQFYRLQNFEACAPLVAGTRLTMEGLALTGAWVDAESGLLGLIVLEVGVSSRLCALLREGEEVVLMGPTGAPTEVSAGGLTVLCGGGLGNAVLFSVARALRAHGSKVLYFAGYRQHEDLFRRDEIEASSDQVVWSVDRGETIPPARPQDMTFRGNIVEAVAAYAAGSVDGRPLFDLRDARRLISIGSDRMMEAVAHARRERLGGAFSSELVSVSSINSPMQCMMKEICGQCLQRHLDPATGQPAGYVFSCFNQDQCSERVDWKNLSDRLRMNSVAEKVTNLWLTRLLASIPAEACSLPVAAPHCY